MSSFCGSNRAHNNLLLDGPPAEDEDALDSSGSGSSARLLQKYALVKTTEDALPFAEVYSLDGLVKRDAEYFLPFFAESLLGPGLDDGGPFGLLEVQLPCRFVVE